MVKISPKNGPCSMGGRRARFGEVFMQPLPGGTGIIAGGPMRAILCPKSAGVTNVLAKCPGSTNPRNVVRATINGCKVRARPPRRGEARQDRREILADRVRKNHGRKEAAKRSREKTLKVTLVRGVVGTVKATAQRCAGLGCGASTIRLNWKIARCAA